MARIYTLTIDDSSTEAEVWQEGSQLFVKIGGTIHEISLEVIDTGRLFSLLMDGHSYEVYRHHRPGGDDLLVGSELYRVEVERGRRRPRERQPEVPAGTQTLRSPMTGIVAAVAVVEGQFVQRGSVLVVLESMKMNNELRSHGDAVVVRVDVSPGQRVERGYPLLELKTGV